MAVKQRGQSIRINDTLQLKLFLYNGSVPTDASEIEKVDIYRLFATEQTNENPNGKLLVETVCDISHDGDGAYSINTELTSPNYTIGRYSDEWTVTYDETLPSGISEQYFSIQPDAWFADSRPIVYDFEFELLPNKVVSGSKRYLTIDISPSVPKNTDKFNYYRNLVSSSDLYITIEQNCGQCMPEEEDLRKVVDRELVTERDLCLGYYFLDTTDMDCGIYHVWFDLELGPNIYVSEKQPLQVFH